MRKIYLFMLALLSAVGAWAQAQDVTIEEGKQYRLQVADEGCTSELYLSMTSTVNGQSDGAGYCLYLTSAKESANFEQGQGEQGQGGWYIKNDNRTYLIRNKHGLRPALTSDVNAGNVKQLFSIETIDAANSLIKIRVPEYNGKSNYFGCRNLTNKYNQSVWGCVVFCNRSATDALVFKLIEVTPRVILTDLISKANTYTAGTQVGDCTQTSIDALTVAINQAQAKVDANNVEESDITALQTAIDNLAFVMPDPSKFYTIAKYNDNNAVIYAQNDAKCNHGTNTTPESVWKFEQGSAPNKFYLKNVGTGLYMTSYAHNATVILNGKTEGVEAQVTGLGTGRQITISCGEQLNRATNRLCVWNESAPINSNSAWVANLVEVGNIAHRLEIGSSKWASLVLGFDAIIPDDVKVYCVSEISGTEAVLKEISGILPANTAVLVNAEAGGHDFVYSPTTTSAVSSRLLGSTTTSYVAQEANTTHYVLSTNSGGNVGFYAVVYNKASNGTAGTECFQNNANKAYLKVSGSGARVMTFNFDGNAETGINAVEIEEAAPANAAIYDLSGRRVQSAKSGLYIVNGKKVIK